MITQKQLEKLSLYFGIDKLTVFREYLQILFLNYLYREKESDKVYFKGGTCLHLLYNSPRFSEDLDFSCLLSKKIAEKLIKKVTENIKKENPGIELIFVYSGKKSLRYKLKYQGKEFKYPLTIRIDFSFENLILKPSISNIETGFPIASFSLILSLKQEEILIEKIRAFLTRDKGRDVFDLWYLFSKKNSFEKKFLDKKLKQVGLKFNEETFLKKFRTYPLKKLEMDLGKFLPKQYRKIIPKLKEEILEFLSSKN